MNAASLTLVEVFPRREGERWRVFAPSREFPAPWWEPEHGVDSTEHWLSAQREGIDVVRCKFVLEDGPLTRKSLGPMPCGQLDILAFEVALSARRQGIGRAALQCAACGGPIEQRGTGRPRRTCSDACRRRLARRPTSDWKPEAASRVTS